MQRITVMTLGLILTSAGLMGGCQKHQSAADDASNEAVIQPKKAPTTDAYPVAVDIYGFLLQTEPLLASKTVDFQKQIYAPVQQLLTRWQLEIKQSDSVIGDPLMICRGALMSFDTWARSVENNDSNQTDKKSVYEKQKQDCGNMLLSRQNTK